MPRSTRHRYCYLAGLLGLAVVSGCATTDKVVPAAGQYELTDQQQAWWERNRHLARRVPGRGLYIEQVGYFDESGRLLDDQGSPISSTETPETDTATEDEGFSIRSFSPGRLIDAAQEMIRGKPSESAAQRSYHDAQNQFQRKQYAAAKGNFSTAAKRWPDSPLEEDALFFVAECEYFSDRYPAADEAYAAVVKKYANTKHLNQITRRRFAIAQYWETAQRKSNKWAFTPNFSDPKLPRFDSGGRALKTYEAIMNSDTRSDLADAAIMATGDALYANGRFEEADFRYQMLIKDYPQSNYLYQAHHQSLKCKIQMYQGPDYSSASLVEAGELVDQMLLQFPQRSRQDRETLLKFRREIRAKKANEDWALAQYYAKRKEYRAARVYYEKIAKKYPDTSRAPESLALIERYQDEPDKAPHPLEWATRWLPREEEAPAARTVGRGSQRR